MIERARFRSSPPVSKKASAKKRRKRWWPCAPACRWAGLQGIASFAEARPGASEAGQKIAAQVFSALCSMASSEKKPLC